MGQFLLLSVIKSFSIYWVLVSTWDLSTEKYFCIILLSTSCYSVGAIISLCLIVGILKADYESFCDVKKHWSDMMQQAVSGLESGQVSDLA